MSYAEEKLHVAVDCLACSHLPLRRRLESAAVSALVKLQAGDFAEGEQRRAFEAMWLAFSDLMRPRSSDGSIAAAMAGITDERAVELARSILSLYTAVASSETS